MIIRITAIWLLSLPACFFAGGQSVINKSVCQNNIVPNNSFEEYINCYPSGGFPYNLQNWSPANAGSVDYLNSCDTSNYLGVPYSIFGYQQAKDGNAYCAFVTFQRFPPSPSNAYNFREYPQVRLSDTLIAGQKYCLTFYVSLADSSAYETNNIGAYFSKDSLIPQTSKVLPYTPQINVTGVISDTSNWTEISGEYIATGGEHFLIFGNFYSDALTDTVPTGISPVTFNQQYFALYYIDNISLCLCSDTVLAEEKVIPGREEINIYPNPAGNKLKVESEKLNTSALLSARVESCQFTIYDLFGREVLVATIREQNQTIDISQVPQGFYVYTISGDKEILKSGKLVIVK